MRNTNQRQQYTVWPWQSTKRKLIIISKTKTNS